MLWYPPWPGLISCEQLLSTAAPPPSTETSIQLQEFVPEPAGSEQSLSWQQAPKQ
jgi:hypothetical protein